MNWPASTWNWKCREVKHIHIFKKQMEKITPNTLQKYTCQKVVLKFESNYAYSTCPTVSKRQYNILKYCSKLILYINYRQYTINSYPTNLFHIFFIKFCIFLYLIFIIFICWLVSIRAFITRFILFSITLLTMKYVLAKAHCILFENFLSLLLI